MLAGVGRVPSAEMPAVFQKIGTFTSPKLGFFAYSGLASASGPAFA
jgi:hypothetical protein